ncbi:MAG: UDP-N-acetylmuramoyl-tripeptide--D-alanyl-D-alanine ligase, partial [Pseudomonadales bacterium]
VMGDMAELGDDEVILHHQVGAYAQQAGVDALYSLGSLSANASQAFGGTHFEDRELLSEALTQELQAALASAPVTFLVKGARSSQMEKTVEMLLTRGNT